MAARWIFDTVWPKKEAGSEITPNLLQAMVHNGAYLAGAFSGDQIVAASFGFASIHGEKHLHSHMTGAVEGFRGSGVGNALKQHQWLWAKERGYSSITWSFDPLVSRNARFNINKLGVEIVSYHENFYGSFMADALNAGDESDRLLARWDLSPAAPASREPRVAQPSSTVIQVPIDIVAIRSSDPIKSKEWRLKVRAEFVRALADGKKTVGFSSDCEYILE